MIRLGNPRGTSLVEVLASIAVFAIIAAGAAKGTISSMRGNSASRDTTAAAALIHDKIEQLRALDPAANPADLSGGFHLDPNSPLTELGARGGIYMRTWSVSANVPRRGLSQVIVTVTWNDGVSRSLSSGTYVCRTSTCS